MGNVFGCIAAGIGWCFCSATGSLISSCCGNDKPSTVPPSVHSGRKRSVFLLFLSICFSLMYQYWIGPELSANRASRVPVLAYMAEAFIDGCDKFNSGNTNNDDEYYYDENLRQKCSGNNGVYRVAGSTFLFYIMFAIAAKCKPSANRDAWPAKYTLFLFLIAGTLFIPNEPLFSPIVLNIFRVGAVIFIIFNQLIILDMAYNINESCVEKANKADLDEGEGAGKKWLGVLIASCATMYIFSLASIGVMFYFFSGCASNTSFIAVTLILGVVSTAVQLTGEEASLFTSASIFAYSTFLCYTAVSKNPDGVCNPQLGDDNIGNSILGIVVTLISMLWAGFSGTAHRAVGEESDAIKVEEEEDGQEGQTGGVVLNGDVGENYGAIDDADENGENDHATFSTSWKLNIILALLCCWYAMSLTSWGAIANEGSIANPSAGEVSMWMVVASQWLMNALYFWTLLAPRLFSDRDFS